jgi:hypothetical protein
MAHMLTKVVLGAVTALMISGSAQAQYYGGGGYGQGYHSSQSYGGGYGQGYYGGRTYGSGYGHGYQSGHYYGRPVAERPHWGGHQRCHQFAKRRVNRWGEMVVKHITRCD